MFLRSCHSDGIMRMLLKVIGDISTAKVAPIFIAKVFDYCCYCLMEIDVVIDAGVKGVTLLWKDGAWTRQFPCLEKCYRNATPHWRSDVL